MLTGNIWRVHRLWWPYVVMCYVCCKPNTSFICRQCPRALQGRACFPGDPTMIEWYSVIIWKKHIVCMTESNNSSNESNYDTMAMTVMAMTILSWITRYNNNSWLWMINMYYLICHFNICLVFWNSWQRGHEASSYRPQHDLYYDAG